MSDQDFDRLVDVFSDYGEKAINGADRQTVANAMEMASTQVETGGRDE